MPRAHILTAVFVAVFAAATTSTLFADPILDFTTAMAGPGGTLSYAGGANPLVGTNIRIGMMTGMDTPANAGSHSVTGNTVTYGVLNFTTGNFASYLANTYTFASGGSFTFRGNVVDAGVSGTGAGALLVSGVFDTSTISKMGTINLFTTTGTGTLIDSTLASYFGLASTTSLIVSGFTLATKTLPQGGGFSLTAYSSDYMLDPEQLTREIQTPEPASMILFGTGLGLLGTAARRRRRLRAAA